MTLPGGYRRTVNESETITAAQPESVEGGGTGTRGIRGFRPFVAVCPIPRRIERISCGGSEVLFTFAEDPSRELL